MRSTSAVQKTAPQGLSDVGSAAPPRKTRAAKTGQWAAKTKAGEVTPLRAWRLGKGRDIEAQARIFKISASMLSRLERRVIDPSPAVARRIYSKTRGAVTPNDLFGLGV